MQERHIPFTATVILALLGAGWHVPLMLPPFGLRRVELVVDGRRDVLVLVERMITILAVVAVAAAITIVVVDRRFWFRPGRSVAAGR